MPEEWEMAFTFTVKSCSGRVEERNNVQTFVEELSLAVFDPELVNASANTNTNVNANVNVRSNSNENVGLNKKASKNADRKLKARDFVRKKAESKGLKAIHLVETFEEYDRAFSRAEEIAIRRLIYEEARRESWEELRNQIANGKLNLNDFDALEVFDTFRCELEEEMERFGLIKREKGRLIFTSKAERILARKALELTLRELEGKDFGEIDSCKDSYYPDSPRELVEYDEFLHTFDSIDIQESLVREFTESPELKFEKLLARKFEKKEKVSFFILIDVSDSMRGEKIKGAIKAALAAKLVAEKLGKNLRIFAFNHTVKRLKSGEIINVSARGRTNIAGAIIEVVRVAERESSSPVVFLITDGEPTFPENPVAKALKAAERLGKIENSRLILMMLSGDERYEEFCVAMTRKVKNSVFLRLRPSDLSVYVLSRFTRQL